MAITKKEGIKSYPASSYLVVEDEGSTSSWHLRVKDENGNPDRRVMGAAWSALHEGYRGNKYEGASKNLSIMKLKKLYQSEGLDTPEGSSSTKATSLGEQVQAVSDAFYAGFSPQGLAAGFNAYIDEVYSDYAIICDTQTGKKYQAGYQSTPEGIVFDKQSEWVEVEETYTSVKSEDFLTTLGSEVKALGEGKVGGYLVRFSNENDPDLSGDFFQMDTDFGFAKKSVILYNHGLDSQVGIKVLGDATLSIDDIGVWIEGQLQLRDAYEKAIYSMAEKGKLGWSSGTAPHLVRRKKVGNANKILSWRLGLDASLTPTPAEPRNSAVAIKNLQITHLQIEGEDPQPQSVEGDTEMETKSNTAGLSADDLKTALAGALEVQKAAQAEEVKRLKEKDELMQTISDLVTTAMKAAPATNKAGLSFKTVSIDSKANETKHFWDYIRTGNVQPYLKAAIDLNEGDNEQGLYLVPVDFFKRVVAKRDEVSIARSAGATVINTSLKVVDIPVEGTREAKFIVPGEKTAYDENAVEPFDKVTATILKYTRMVKISEELLADQAANLEEFLADRLGRTAGITENDIFLTGASTLGIVTTSGLGATAPSNSAVSAANILDCYYALSQPYRDNANWVMRGATEGAIRKLTVANNYAFVQTPQGLSGQTGFSWLVSPSSRVYNSDEMDAIGSAAKSIVFGNFSYYYIVERAGLAIRRLNERYADTGQVGLLASFRVGGAVAQAEAFKHILHPTTT